MKIKGSVVLLRTKYDGSGFFLHRGAEEVTVAASAVHSSSYQGDAITRESLQMVHGFLEVTSAGTGTVTLKVECRDPSSGTWVSIGSAVAASGVGTFPVVASSPSRTFRLTTTHTDGSSWTYSLGAVLMHGA